MTDVKTEYIPDSVSPPGETLLETLETLGMTQAELATRMGRPKKTINEIIKGRTAITPETALQLEMALGIAASFWTERERMYQEAIARVEQDRQLAQWIDWLKNIPYNEMVSLGWIRALDEPAARVREVLTFFGVVSPEQWEVLWGNKVNVAFRESRAYSTDKVATAAWLRRAELEARDIDCAPYDENLFRQVLLDVRSLTRTPPSPSLYQEELTRLCRTAGVAVTVVRRLSKTRTFGASQWLSPQKAHIAINLYHSSDDQFWFTFFHEAAHILSHSKKEVFIDKGREKAKTKEEMEANEFAAELLVPSATLDRFIKTRRLTKSGDPFFDKDDIYRFAESIGIAPSIVVGQLQHLKVLKPKFRNELKTWLKWDDEGNLIIR